jgi:hypothetical protein
MDDVEIFDIRNRLQKLVQVWCNSGAFKVYH